MAKKKVCNNCGSGKYMKCNQWCYKNWHFIFATEDRGYTLLFINEATGFKLPMPLGGALVNDSLFEQITGTLYNVVDEDNFTTEDFNNLYTAVARIRKSVKKTKLNPDELKLKVYLEALTMVILRQESRNESRLTQ